MDDTGRGTDGRGIRAMEGLNPREREILPLVAKGLNNREIGSLLFISDKTVKNYVTSIKRKLELDNRTQIALYAIRHGIADPLLDHGER